MKITVVLNGVSRKKKIFYSSILPVISRAHEVLVVETQQAGDAKALAMQHATSCDAIMAAGGDGTLHEVVNGLLAKPYRPALGIIPLGSGNDFAGACGIKADGAHLLQLLQRPPKATDIGHITCRSGTGHTIEEYFINVCSAGMGPSSVSKMASMPRWLGAQGRYLMAIVQTFFTHKPEEISVQAADFVWHGRARVAAIANGQSFGNKIFIAPDAKADDGQFNLFLGGAVPLPQFLWYLLQIKSKHKVSAPQIAYAVASSVQLSSAKAAMLEADGELIGYLPATICCVEPLQFYR